MSTGPIDRNGWPNARIEFPSAQVTVPVAERTMSPSRRTAATAEPGSRRESSDWPGCPAAATVDAGVAPLGATSQPAASATREKTVPGVDKPEKETGSGSGEGPLPVPAGSPRDAPTSWAKGFWNLLSPNADISAAVCVAAPPIGTGGVGGAFRMSSMLWIGVMPQMGSRAKGHPYASAPMSLPSM